MKNILTLNEFVEHRIGDELNEGLLGILSGLFGALTKKDWWASIKCDDNNLKNELKKIDDSLSGYTLMKIKNSDKCQEIRQILTDLSSEIFDAKNSEYEENKKHFEKIMTLNQDSDEYKKALGKEKFLKQFNIKDKAIADNIEIYEKKLKDACADDPDLLKWANSIKDGIRIIINNHIIARAEEDGADGDKVKEQKSKTEKDSKELESERKKLNSEAKKTADKQAKELETNRNGWLKNIGVSTLINKNGKDAVTEIDTKFGAVLKDLEKAGMELIKESAEAGEKEIKGLIDALKKDTELGFSNLTQLTDSGKIKVVVYSVKGIYDALKKNYNKQLEQLSGVSLQAMFAGLCCVICNAVDEKAQVSKDAYNLLTRCIVKNTEIGYGFPLVDEKQKDPKKQMTIFNAILSTLTDISEDGVTAKALKAMDEKNYDSNKSGFTKRIAKTFSTIKGMATKLENELQKQKEAAAKKAETEEEKK